MYDKVRLLMTILVMVLTALILRKRKAKRLC